MLTPLELDIMKAVWRCPPITVRDVQAAIRPARKLAYTTVMTIMDRLHHKGFLARKLQLRTHYYEPAITYTAVRDDALNTLLESFFSGSREKLQEFLGGNSEEVPENGNAPATAPSSLDETLL